MMKGLPSGGDSRPFALGKTFKTKVIENREQNQRGCPLSSPEL